MARLRGCSGDDQPIVTRPTGYAVRLASGQLDLERFRTPSQDARRARAGDAEAAAAILREALELFRGAPLADVPLRVPRRSSASASRGCGSGSSRSASRSTSSAARTRAVGEELRALAAEHPYRERVHGQ